MTNRNNQAVISGEYYLPLYFQAAKAVNPLRSGVLVLPLNISQAVVGLATGIFIHWSGRYRECIWVGTVLLTIGNGLYVTLTEHSSLAHTIGLQLISALGGGMLFSPPLIA